VLRTNSRSTTRRDSSFASNEGDSHSKAAGKTDPHFSGDQNIPLAKICKSYLVPVNEYF
jgi:hypothetical protein